MKKLFFSANYHISLTYINWIGYPCVLGLAGMKLIILSQGWAVQWQLEWCGQYTSGLATAEQRSSL